MRGRNPCEPTKVTKVPSKRTSQLYKILSDKQSCSKSRLEHCRGNGLNEKLRVSKHGEGGARLQRSEFQARVWKGEAEGPAVPATIIWPLWLSLGTSGFAIQICP